MTDIVTERTGSILRVQFNRPAKKNAMTFAMYLTMADLFNTSADEDRVQVVLWHGAGDSFCAGNGEDAAKNAVETAGRKLRDLRVAEVVKTDMTVKDGKVQTYRTRVLLSFKYES